MSLDILNYLSEHPDKFFSVTELAELTGKDKGNLSRIIKKLREEDKINYIHGEGRTPSKISHKSDLIAVVIPPPIIKPKPSPATISKQVIETKLIKHEIDKEREEIQKAIDSLNNKRREDSLLINELFEDIKVLKNQIEIFKKPSTELVSFDDFMHYIENSSLPSALHLKEKLNISGKYALVNKERIIRIIRDVLDIYNQKVKD